VTGPAQTLWTFALALAVLWPGRVLSTFDGIPLNGRAEAVLVGLVLPSLLWLDRSVLARPLTRAAIVALLVLKIGAAAGLPQHGLCARFSTTAPLKGVISTIDVDEPEGTLRSWDARAAWRAATPQCTAILDRPYRSRLEFPASFLNLLLATRDNPEDLALDVDGYVTVDRPGTFTMETGDLIGAGQVAGTTVTAAGERIAVPLAAGTHAIRLHLTPKGERWRFEADWNGEDAWGAARLTTSPPSAIDRRVSPLAARATSALVLLIVAAWAAAAVVKSRLPAPALLWSAAGAVALILFGISGRFERFAGPLLAVSVLATVARPRQNVRAAFILIGVPWLALFAARSWNQIGQTTLYSAGDDWQMYQAAAYRIFLNGYWVQGGSATFYFQPLYRWVAGALHVVFGDSSVGETYWDAACVLIAALACFAVVKSVAGFRWGIVAASATLATFTISPAWYFIGRGLSEITGLGWLSLAALFLMRARLGRRRAAAAAGVFAVLMFYTRLNHLLLGGFLLAALLPQTAPAQWDGMRRAVRRVHASPAFVYLAIVAAGMVLFAAHTWWYAGHFSLVYGTSFAVQRTGLGSSTMASTAVWSRIGEGLAAQLSMREPPAVDPRSVGVAAGAVLSLLALVQVPGVSRLPAALALITVGTIAGSLFAHTHDYPGRMSIHVVPFAIAMSVCAAARVAGWMGQAGWAQRAGWAGRAGRAGWAG
jgi:hypothetical protein